MNQVNVSYIFLKFLRVFPELIDFIRKTDNKVNLNFKKKTKGDKVEE